MDLTPEGRSTLSQRLTEAPAAARLYSRPTFSRCADWATAGNASYQPFINALFIDGSVPQNAA